MVLQNVHTATIPEIVALIRKGHNAAAALVIEEQFGTMTRVQRAEFVTELSKTTAKIGRTMPIFEVMPVVLDEPTPPVPDSVADDDINRLFDTLSASFRTSLLTALERAGFTGVYPHLPMSRCVAKEAREHLSRFRVVDAKDYFGENAPDAFIGTIVQTKPSDKDMFWVEASAYEPFKFAPLTSSFDLDSYSTTRWIRVSERRIEIRHVKLKVIRETWMKPFIQDVNDERQLRDDADYGAFSCFCEGTNHRFVDIAFFPDGSIELLD